MPVKKKTPVKNISKTDIQIEKALIENFVALQKVLTNLSIKFDNLADKISKLLELFEISAKALAEKGENFGKQDNSELKEKLDNLLEQNRTIAKGISLLHERGSSAISSSPASSPEYRESMLSRRQGFGMPRR